MKINAEHLRRRRSGRGRRIGAMFFSLLMLFSTLLSAMPAMSLKARADDPYASFKDTTTVIHFDGKEWYLIDYDDSTVTLLTKECVCASMYNDFGVYVEYASSTAKAAVDNWYSNNISADAKTAVNGEMFLLTIAQARAITNADVLKCPQASGAINQYWWLCSPGGEERSVAGVDGIFGFVSEDMGFVNGVSGVRPALQLDLGSVIFNPVDKTFTLPKAVSSLTLDKTTTQTIIKGNNVSFTATLAPENASYVKWSVTGDAVTLYSDAECTSAITTDSATYIKTVYAKGTEAGNATVTVTSASDATKSAGCAVSVKYEGDPYAAMVNNSAATVKFNDLDWYIIEDDSTAEDAGTLTLLAKDPIAASKFHDSSNVYSSSTVKSYLGGLTTGEGSFVTVADAIETVSVTTNKYNSSELYDTAADVKLYLLSTEEAQGLPVNIQKCAQASGANTDFWWLRSPGGNGDIMNASQARFVSGGSGGIFSGSNVNDTLGVRPALKLDLSRVVFSSDINAFTLKTLVTGVSLSPSTAALTVGAGAVALTASVAPDDATDKKVKWSVGGSNAGAVKLYTDEYCNTEVGTAATSTLTVYAKGISIGKATVTVSSNEDSTKSAGCAVSVTYEGNPYTAMVNNSAATVKFNDLDWYIIEDNSTAADAGTVTLLAKDPIAASKFNDSVDDGDRFSTSKVKGYLAGLVAGTKTFGESKSFKDVAAAIETVTVTTEEYSGTLPYYSDVIYDTAENVKLYLLSTKEAYALPENVRKCSTADANYWWLRSPGLYDYDAACVHGGDGNVYRYGGFVSTAFGVRPALKLNLESVIFTSDSRTFTVKPAPTVTTAPEALSLTYNGNEQELVTAGQTADGTFYYALGDNAETAPEFDGLSAEPEKKWSTDIPKASAVGSYPVWYMVKGDASHLDSEAACITAEIKAQTAPHISSYTIHFDMNGHGTAIDSKTVRRGEQLSRPEPDPVDDEYDFGGWYKDKECTKEYDFNQKVTRGFTLYAKWTKKDAESFTVSFDMNGHGTAIADMSVKSGEQLSRPEPDPVDEGYDFGGWYTDKECTQEYDFSQEVTESFTLYAKWTEKVTPAFRSALDSVPETEADTSELYLVKGQKFIIGKDWSVKKDDKASKDLVRISKKGQLKTRKAGKATIWNGERSLVLHISAPSVPKKLKLQITADGAESKAIELTNPDGLPVYWFSASPDVATVDQEGMVTAVSAGKSKVTAYINGSTYNCTVTVKEAAVAKERSLHILEGKTKNLSIKGVKKPVWSSADEDTASFTKKNKLTAKKAGDTILTATAADGTEYKVHLYVENITLSGDGLTPAKGKNKYNLTLKAGESTELSFANVEQDVVFKSSKPDSVFIDENGKVFARAKGKSKFTTKLNGKTITVNVIVEE